MSRATCRMHLIPEIVALIRATLTGVDQDVDSLTRHHRSATRLKRSGPKVATHAKADLLCSL
jgi:hypothetical protein